MEMAGSGLAAREMKLSSVLAGRHFVTGPCAIGCGRHNQPLVVLPPPFALVEHHEHVPEKRPLI